MQILKIHLKTLLARIIHLQIFPKAYNPNTLIEYMIIIDTLFEKSKNWFPSQNT